MRFSQRDSEALDAVGYNQLFWDANIIVKRTPLEAKSPNHLNVNELLAQYISTIPTSSFSRITRWIMIPL
jgi:hypothetical protein